MLDESHHTHNNTVDSCMGVTEQIIAMIEDGDSDVLLLLHNNFSVPIARYITSKYDYLLSNEDVEDITQDTLLDIFNSKYDPTLNKSFKSWVIMNADWTTRRFLQRRRHETGKQLSEENAAVNWAMGYELVLKAPPVDTEPCSDEMSKILQAKLKPTPHKYIWQRFYEGRSLSAMSDENHRAISTVKSQISRALKALKEVPEIETLWAKLKAK